MKNSEKCLLAAACLFAGVILGFLIAPIKKGITCVQYGRGSCAPDACACDDEDALEG